MREIRVGDRFLDTRYLDIWEYLEPSDEKMFPHRAKCIEATDPSLGIHKEKGSIDTWNFNEVAWKYLGNFSKTSNFNNLYNKLNENKG